MQAATAACGKPVNTPRVRGRRFGNFHKPGAKGRSAVQVLFVRNFLQPHHLNVLGVGLLQGEMDHGIVGRGAVSVALAGDDEDGVAGMDFADWLSG